MRWFLPLLVLVGLGWLAWCCAGHHATAIEADIRQRAEGVATQSPWAGVSVDGRDLTVSGKPPTPAAARIVLDQLRGLRGVRVVHEAWASQGAEDTGSAASTHQATPLMLTAALQGGTAEQTTVKLSGTVPTVADARSLQAYLAGHHSRPRIAAELVADDSASGRHSALFRQAAATGIRGLLRLADGKLQVDEHQLTLAGTTRSALSQRLLDADMRRNLPDGYRYQSLLTAAVQSVQSVKRTQPLTAEQRAVVTACQAGFDGLMRHASIQFSSNSDALKAASAALLDRIAVQAKACQNTRVLIAGHSDNTGDPTYNIDLSQRRAEAVRQALIARNIDGGRLQARGYGAMHPRADNSTASGRAANRRIEFTLTYATAETTP